MTGWTGYLNDEVLIRYGTQLVGGFSEPFYKAPRGDLPAEIQFTLGYERSALHELAHWSIAGEARRRVDDYGYWYEPDGRTIIQQQTFYRLEIRPQAIEQHFCMTLGIPFEVSMDNLALMSQEDREEFIMNIDNQYALYREDGLPDRARKIVGCLHQWRHPGQQRTWVSLMNPAA